MQTEPSGTPADELTVAELIQHYRQCAEGTSAATAREANRWHARLHACFQSLRHSPEGIEAMATLMTDPSEPVRLWAASHSLSLGVPSARSVLEQLRDTGAWMAAFDAEMVLREFDAGRLSFDY